jgi:hypothetical protein
MRAAVAKAKSGLSQLTMRDVGENTGTTGRTQWPQPAVRRTTTTRVAPHPTTSVAPHPTSKCVSS